MKIPDIYADLLGAPHFGHLATVNKDGTPQSTPIWLLREGDDLLFSTRDDRRKAANIRRNPAVSISIHDQKDPYRYVELRGMAEITPAGNYTLVDRLAKAYLGKDEYPWKTAEDMPHRVVVRVRVSHLSTQR